MGPLGYQIFLVFILVGVIVSLISEKIKVSYTSFLLVLGMSLTLINSVWKVFPQVSTITSILSAQVFFGLVLPPIIFKASLDINYQAFRKNIWPIAYMATLGVVLSTILVALVMHFLLSLPWFYSFLFATIISPTDPVGVIVLLRRYHAPADTATLVEGEALLNDATAITIFSILLAFKGGIISISGIAGEAALAAIASPLIGFAFGIVSVLLINRLQSYESRITTLLVSSYISFTAAQAIGGSGILAEIITGILVSTQARAHKEEFRGFWSVIDYIMTSLIFMAVGLIFNPFLIYSYILIIAIAFSAVFVVRVLLSRTLGLFRKFSYDIPTVSLSGIRGAIPIVLALNLTSYVLLKASYTQLIQTMTIGVAAVSLLVQATIAQWNIRRKYTNENAQ
ncbi:MAG: cation:proton antiporter [Nitrososphaerota archaeon]|nr:cation:proton antiporter [Nitrososphaerota archaeon]MDG6929855.1 cation:proton antiporter [Nitrososphaerota archaeon]